MGKRSVITSEEILEPVSYTHLDVYKRQEYERRFPSEYLVEEFFCGCLICAQYVDLHCCPSSRALPVSLLQVQHVSSLRYEQALIR